MSFLEHSHLLGLFFCTDDAFPCFLGVSPHQAAFDLDGTPHSWISWKTVCLPLLWPQTEQQESLVRVPGAVICHSGRHCARLGSSSVLFVLLSRCHQD